MKKHSMGAKQAFMRKTFKVKVQPRPEDESLLRKVNSSLIVLWNLALEQCNNWLKMEKGDPNKKPITPISLNFWLTGVRDTNPDITAVSVSLERETLRRLAGGFSSFFALLKAKDRRAHPPGPRDSENSFMALTWTDKSFSLSGNRLIGSVGSRMSVVFFVEEYILEKLAELPSGSKLAQVTISRRDGEYWASFVCNIPRPETATPKGVMGIDLGAGHVAVSCSNGDEFLIPTRRPDKFWMKRIYHVEKRVDLCKKGSRAWKRRMGARRSMHNRGFNQHKDHQRKLAHFLARMGMTIVVGKMKTRLGLAQSKDGTPEQHRGAQNTGYLFRLLTYIKEKAEEHGLQVLEVRDPERQGSLEDPTSKFNSSRRILEHGCKELDTLFPKSFQEKKVVINQ